MSNHRNTKRIERTATLRWVPLARTRVNPAAQRALKQSRVDELAANFDPEQFGSPTVNRTADGWFHILDGQHRIEALKQWFGEGNWEDQQIQCWTYDGLTDAEEAEVFLKLNNTLQVTAMAKYKVGVQAGRSDEAAVDKVVRSLGLKVATDNSAGTIHAVGTLMRIYKRSDAETLRRTLTIAWEAYGDPGLEAAILDGIGLVCHRYNGELDDAHLIRRLAGTRGGVNTLLRRAEDLKLKTGHSRGNCVAAAVVEINNAGRGGRKLPSWWRES